MVLSLIGSAPLLYGAVVLLDLKGSSALWQAITETEITVGYVSTICAGLLLLALVGIRQMRRAPWTLLACLATANATLPVLNGQCLRSKSPQSLDSSGPRAFFAAVVFVYMAQRLLVISLAHMLVLIARGRAALATRLVPWYPAVAFLLSALYSVVWAVVGDPNANSRMMQCWFRYGQVEAATETVVIVLECVVITLSLIAVEKAHQRVPLPHDLGQVLYEADSKRSRAFAQWHENPSADAVENGLADDSPSPGGGTGCSGEEEAKVEEDRPRGGPSQRLRCGEKRGSRFRQGCRRGLQAVRPRGNWALTPSVHPCRRCQVAERQLDRRRRRREHNDVKCAAAPPPPSLSSPPVRCDSRAAPGVSVDESGGVGDKFRLQLVLLWELAGQVLSLATGVAYLIGGVPAVRESSIMQIRFIGVRALARPLAGNALGSR